MQTTRRGGRAHRLRIFRRGDVLRDHSLLIWHTFDGSPVPRLGQIWPRTELRLSLIGRFGLAERTPATMAVTTPIYDPDGRTISAVLATTYDLSANRLDGRDRPDCLQGSRDRGAVVAAVAASRQVPFRQRGQGGGLRPGAEPYVDPRPFAVPTPLAAFVGRPPIVASPALERAARVHFGLRPDAVVAAEQREYAWVRILPRAMPGYIMYPLECFPACAPAPERVYLDLEEARGMARPNRAFDFLLREGLLPPGTAPRAFRRRPEARERAVAALEALDAAELARRLGRYRDLFASGFTVTDDDLIGSITRPDLPLVASDMLRAMRVEGRSWGCSRGPWRIEIRPAAPHVSAAAS